MLPIFVQAEAFSHLTNIMAEGDPPTVGIREVIVWGGRKILDALPERPWLRPVHVPVLDAGFFKCQYWQRITLPRLARDRCDLLFAPGGSGGGFSPFVTMSRNMLPFEWKEIRRYGVFSIMTLRFIALRIAQSAAFSQSGGPDLLVRVCS